MEDSQHVREGVEHASWVSFRFLTGLVGLVAFAHVAVELVELVPHILHHRLAPLTLFNWCMILTPRVGWGGLVYACWIRSGRITDAALFWALAGGVLGMMISVLVLAGGPLLPTSQIGASIVYLTGTWILNGLGIVWIVDKVRRIRAASNTSTED